jgi:hypothetical protein
MDNTQSTPDLSRTELVVISIAIVLLLIGAGLVMPGIIGTWR